MEVQTRKRQRSFKTRSELEMEMEQLRRECKALKVRYLSMMLCKMEEDREAKEWGDARVSSSKGRNFTSSSSTDWLEEVGGGEREGGKPEKGWLHRSK